MSAPEPAVNTAHPLLVVIDPVARRSDGESVRIAKDVLCAGANVRVCLPEGPEEFARALARRGSRRPVVVGDDRALLRAVALLHRERELGAGALALIPVGASVDIAQALGVPIGAVAAARAVLEGRARRLDLLVDDSDGVVLGDLRIPAAPSPKAAAASLWGTCRSLVRTLVRPAPPSAPHPVRTYRLRVEADGVLLNDLDRPVEDVSVCSRAGRAEVVIRPRGGEHVRVEALAVTVSGPDFRYRADALVAGPVRTRTWTVRPGAWSLTLPA
ncbi:diacylglycerol kinase [Streptomyces agglomeratus]|uniref:Diacylglycerol kinase n=1 Tax=Streptomyces agglomeratus TaxID=285458 RepID=A0A1E5P8K0_9ACTN|nr:diacylglycerol kinase [Streptomyces agglomeratus]OEJ25848.1 diacylglycerol kinase [Streptomyces agglomeratus]OEJ40096.1 diacylglycerol kinase [Streptomyces agglomeratus]OEJ45524.1 diacylglycerol kinase [Streptomyces agglomeratus]OEJ52658.1 diacylglycerol kinase [Streptomyces agglomeratus]OEJ60013.1 diacylglycerol kinase [Streptomyces agglomeratus]